MPKRKTKSTEFNSESLRLVGDIVSAYVRNNQLPVSELPAMIRSVYATLGSLMGKKSEDVATARRAIVSVKNSISADHIVCLEDGKKLKMLKRHLRTRYGLTPEQYRAKWHLPANYPMVAANYSASRSALAKEIGLGRFNKAPRKLKRT